MGENFFFLGGGYLLGVPTPIYIFALVCIIAAIVLGLTPFGRAIYAVGSNEEAARLSGINVPRVIFGVYTICGLLAALSGLIFLSRLSVGDPNSGLGLELEAITIAVIGVLAGNFIKEKLVGKGNVVEIKGDPAVAPAVERHDGFAEAIAGTDIKVIAETHADWDQEKALKFMEDTLQRFPAGQIQAVYTHNDNMAFGALRAIQAAGRDKEGILIVGIDGENAAIRAVAKGDLAATFTYSTVAPEGVIAAHALAMGDMKALEPLGTMTKKDDGSMEVEIASTMITKDNAESMFCKGFGDDPECK